MTFYTQHDLCSVAWRRYQHLIFREAEVLDAPSTIAGRGLFVLNGLMPNQVVVEYNGVALNNEQAERAADNSCHVRMNMDTVVDGKDVGVGFLANHSCNPNSCYKTIKLGGREKKEVVFIYTKKRVYAGSRITVDYGWTTDPSMRKESLVECLCEEPNCRYLI